MSEAPHTVLALFLARCDPAAPAEAAAYVPRPQPFAPWLAQVMRSVGQAKVLVIGQTGVGKSTELARLADSLNAEFTIIRPPIDEILDFEFAGWHDVLVAAALGSGKPSVNQDVLDMQLTESLSSRGVPQPSGLQALRNDPRGVHGRIVAARAQFWDMAIDALNEPAQGKRAIVLALDGLEKLDRAAAHRLFVEERHLLARVPFRVIVTAPLSLSFEPYFGEIEADFLAVTRLRAFTHRPGQPGFGFLKNLALKRGALDVMTEALLDEAVGWSGGLPRQLLQLLAGAATQALLDGLTRVERETFARGRRKVAERWQYQLEPSDYDALVLPDEERTTAQRSRLLALGALLEYDQPDGGLGLGVNPLVAALLDERRAKIA